MEPTATFKPAAPVHQDPPHGGSWVRQADGSLAQREGTMPAGTDNNAPQAGAEEE